MKIEIKIENSGDWERVELFVKNGLCQFSGYDLFKADDLKELEKNLLEIIEKLKQHRGA